MWSIVVNPQPDDTAHVLIAAREGKSVDRTIEQTSEAYQALQRFLELVRTD